MNKPFISQRSIAHMHTLLKNAAAHPTSTTQSQAQIVTYNGRAFGPSSSPRPMLTRMTLKQSKAWFSKKTASNLKAKTRSKKTLTPIDTAEEGHDEPDENNSEIAASSLSGKGSSEYAQQQQQQSWGGNGESSDEAEKNTKQLTVAQSRFKKRTSGSGSKLFLSTQSERSALSHSFADQLAKCPADPNAIAKLYIPAVLAACNQANSSSNEKNQASSTKTTATLRTDVHTLTAYACQAMPSHTQEAFQSISLTDVRKWLIDAQTSTPLTASTSLSKTVNFLIAPLVLNLNKRSKHGEALLKNLMATAMRH